jgi:hypothetical protein
VTHGFPHSYPRSVLAVDGRDWTRFTHWAGDQLLEFRDDLHRPLSSPMSATSKIGASLSLLIPALLRAQLLSPTARALA